VTPLVSDPVSIAALALVACAPFAAVAIVALIRGYTISLHMKRPDSARRRRRRLDDDD
jgi:hypothetical protein